VLLHDSAADVEVFLRAIFDSSFFMPPPELIQLDFLLSILRLSHKYNVQYIHRRALKHLVLSNFAVSVNTFKTDKKDIIYSVPDIQSRLTIVKAAKEVGAL
ncbi:hypothetical protein C8R43DRAFT_903739, partial [Mycena crocata]